MKITLIAGARPNFMKVAPIIKAYEEMCGRVVHFPPLFGDAHASEKILSEIISYLNL